MFTSMASLSIPDIYTSLDGERFLVRDDGEGANRVLLFTTGTHLAALDRAPVWVADGCFSSNPPHTKQAPTTAPLS